MVSYFGAVFAGRASRDTRAPRARMARSLKTGSKVRVLRGPFLKQEGVVLEAVGSGRSRKWKVRFGSGLESEFAARTLELCGVPQASNGSNKQKSPAAPACAAESDAGQCADDSSACEPLEERFQQRDERR